MSAAGATAISLSASYSLSRGPGRRRKQPQARRNIALPQRALFLKLPEFDRKVLEVLREPLETGHITISRANRQADFPANFQLIAAMNPAPAAI